MKRILILLTFILLNSKISFINATGEDFKKDENSLSNSVLNNTHNASKHEITSNTKHIDGQKAEYKKMAAIKTPFIKDDFYKYYPKTKDNKKASIDRLVNIKIGETYILDKDSNTAVIGALVNNFAIRPDYNIVDSKNKVLNVTALFNTISSNGGYTHIAKVLNPQTIAKYFISDIQDKEKRSKVIDCVANLEDVQSNIFGKMTKLLNGEEINTTAPMANFKTDLINQNTQLNNKIIDQNTELYYRNSEIKQYQSELQKNIKLAANQSKDIQGLLSTIAGKNLKLTSKKKKLTSARETIEKVENKLSNTRLLFGITGIASAGIYAFGSQAAQKFSERFFRNAA